MQWLFAPLLAVVALAWFCVRLEASGAFDAICSAVRKMPVGRRFVFFALAAVFIAFAGTKTNSPPMNLPPLPPIFPPVLNPPLPALNPGSPSDAGFVVVGEETGTCVIVPPPVGAVTQETWRLRGAHEDHVRIPSAPGWSMLTPSGRVDSLDVLASGGFGVSPCDSFYPQPFADGLSVAPAAHWNVLAGEGRASIFWHALTPSNSLLATWQDALLGRSATNIVSFQAEFQPGGRFEYRYGDRLVSYLPVPPFDLDGDGLENSVDPDPLVPGPDAHGTNVEWYNIVCSNVLTAVEGQDGVELSWLAGVNSNAYFFAEVVADIGTAAVYFTCDTETSLGSPVVVALAGETNRVPLLVGVGYSVSSDVPFSVSVPDGATAVSNGVSAFRVERPVSFEFVPDTTALATGVVAYAVLVDPPGLEGAFAWESNGQPLPQRGGTAPLRAPPMRSGSGGGCGFVGFGDYVIFTCGESCDCGGCEAVGSYTYENVYIPVSGGPCGCTPHDDPPEDPDDPTSGGGGEPPDPPPPFPSVTVSVDSSVIVFEGEYMDMPGTNVPRRSSYVVVEVDYSAADNDATGTFSVHSGGSHIILHDGSANGPVVSSWPFSVVANATGHHVFYAEGLTASTGADDVTFKAEISDGEESNSDQKDISVVEVRLEPCKTAPANPSPRRHTFGVAEMVKCIHNPSGVPVSWEVGGQANMIFTNGFQTMVCPIIAEMGCSLKATCSGVEHVFNISVLNPSGITCQQWSWGGMDLPKGTAGGAGMYLRLYVQPMTVNFEGIALEEVPSNTGTHYGYFAQTNQMASWYHDRYNGAGLWQDVTTGNFWTSDNAKVNVKSPPWSFGTKSWNIPIGWNERGTDYHAPHIHELSTSYQQNFIITVEGTVTVMKHEHWASRSTNDCWILDGVIIHGEE